MRIEPQLIDDLKTDRSDIAPPLPPAARLVPILFYLSLLAALVLLVLFSINLANATRLRDQFRAQTQQAQAELNALRSERASLEARAKRASDLQLWTESTRPIQPLIVEIARSLERDASIAYLNLLRNPNAQQNLDFQIRLNSSSQIQLDRIINRLSELGYRTYSPEQKFARGQIEFTATLIHQPRDLLQETSASPEPTTTSTPHQNLPPPAP